MYRLQMCILSTLYVAIILAVLFEIALLFLRND